MKNIYILICISALIACSDKSQNKAPSGSDAEKNVMYTAVNKQKTTVTSEPLVVSEITKESDQSIQISCLNQDITEWYGFDEATIEPKCETVKNFKLQSYKCNTSKNAFGADRDAILLENQDQRIFVYSNSKICKEILEIRNSNAL